MAKGKRLNRNNGTVEVNSLQENEQRNLRRARIMEERRLEASILRLSRELERLGVHEAELPPIKTHCCSWAIVILVLIMLAGVFFSFNVKNVALKDLRRITTKIDRGSGAEPMFLKNVDVGLAKMICTKPMVVETFSEYAAIGRFALRDMRQSTVAVGVTKNVEKKEPRGAKITKAAAKN